MGELLTFRRKPANLTELHLTKYEEIVLQALRKGVVGHVWYPQRRAGSKVILGIKIGRTKFGPVTVKGLLEKTLIRIRRGGKTYVAV